MKIPRSAGSQVAVSGYLLLPSVMALAFGSLLGVRFLYLVPVAVLAPLFPPVNLGSVARTGLMAAVLTSVTHTALLHAHVFLIYSPFLPWRLLFGAHWLTGLPLLIKLVAYPVAAAVALMSGVILGLFIGLLISIFIGTPAIALINLENLARQHVRDRRAQRLGKLVRDGRAPAYSLYLRPFSTTDRLATLANVILSPGTSLSTGMSVANIQQDFEAKLAASFPAHRPIIAVGAPGTMMCGFAKAVTTSPPPSFIPLEVPSTGKIPATDETWRDLVANLVGPAELIVVVPLDFPGTQWEINLLHRAGLIHKCVFYMPATMEGNDSYAAAWQGAMTALAPLGLVLPDYTPRGALIMITRSGDVIAYKLPSLALTRFVRFQQFRQHARRGR
ncbi:hypothetical protein [Streptomyces roseoverticillatus]|uniref:Uncharacterized protein n=1 Tax=Streptomyces roseoverticillatus TaxID=66429 RepID=A0ABV3IPC4_9ACTN